MVKARITEFWHSKLSEESKSLSILKFLQTDFLQFNGKAHPLWRSCQSSSTALYAATQQARLLSGRYQHDALRAKFCGGDPTCKIPGCNVSPSDTVHLLSGQCLPLQLHLNSSLSNCLKFLEDSPTLSSIVLAALKRSDFEWCKFLLDPSCDITAIRVAQEMGREGNLAHVQDEQISYMDYA